MVAHYNGGEYRWFTYLWECWAGLNISFQYTTSIFSVYHSSGLRPVTQPSPAQPSTILNWMHISHIQEQHPHWAEQNCNDEYRNISINCIAFVSVMHTCKCKRDQRYKIRNIPCLISSTKPPNLMMKVSHCSLDSHIFAPSAVKWAVSVELCQLFQSSHQKCCLNTARQIAARRQKFRSIFAEQSAVQRVQAPGGDVCTVSEQGGIFSVKHIFNKSYWKVPLTFLSFLARFCLKIRYLNI